MTRLARAAVPALLLCALVGGPAGAAAPDWSAVAHVREIQVLSQDEDGSPRETTVWLAVLDGQGYIRTSRSTTWGDNVERDPDVVVRIEGQEYAVRAAFVSDPELRARVVADFRAKYGWTDGILGVFRGSDPRIMRLDPR